RWGGWRGQGAVGGCRGLDGQELQGVEPVGNYAIAPRWEDGHDTGLYSFRLLRQLCPCAACGGGERPARSSRRHLLPAPLSPVPEIPPTTLPGLVKAPAPHHRPARG